MNAAWSARVDPNRDPKANLVKNARQLADKVMDLMAETRQQQRTSLLPR
jgi:hypothetical protein